MNFLRFFLIQIFCILSISICVCCLNKRFLSEQQNLDEDWSSKEEIAEYPKEESNENNDFKFDDQSTFKDSEEEEEKDAENELYQFWNNLDMCNDVNCKSDQICVINKRNVAVCIDRNQVIGHISKLKHTKSQNLRSQKCNECPNLNSNDIYCASNNRSYSSLCELIKFNCENLSDYYPLCQDECPCSKKQSLNKKMKLDYLWMYINGKRNQFNQISIKRIDRRQRNQNEKINENKLLKSTNQINYSAKIDGQKLNNSTKDVCSAKELNDIGQRLYNWFSIVLKNQLTKQNERSTKFLNKIQSSFVQNCDEQVNFMFLNYLDTNKDLQLSLDELYHLKHDQHEKCLNIYIDSCDTNGDKVLNNNEWCYCFAQFRPCIKERNNILIKNRINQKLSLNYIPNCDSNGHYQALQCNKLTKYCWCVDKNGNEIANTRKIGNLLVCDKSKINKNLHPIDDDSEGDDDFEDYQNESEGSGD